MEKLYLKKRSKRKSSLNQTSSGRDKISNVDFFICVKQNCEILGDHGRTRKFGSETGSGCRATGAAGGRTVEADSAGRCRWWPRPTIVI